MCTIILFYKIFDTYPLVIASNRDEAYGRKAAPPRRLSQNPVILGGQDLEAGGTWMGVNEAGLWAGIANRPGPLPNPTQKRSRGMLCMDLLGNPACEEAVSLLDRVPAGTYNPFYVLIADRDTGTFATNPGTCEMLPLRPGIHIMTNHGLDSDHDPRRERILNRHGGLLHQKTLPDRDALTAVLRDHGENASDAVCIHGETGGTRSGTVLFLHRQIEKSRYFFAEGAPCRTPFSDYSDLFGHAEESRGAE